MTALGATYRRVACQGKVSYLNFSTAKAVARRYGNSRPYRCSVCRKIHLGPPTVKRKKRYEV